MNTINLPIRNFFRNKPDAVLNAFLFLFCCFGFSAFAQTPSSPTDCRSGCTSNDVQIIKAYLSNSAGTQLPSTFVCPGSGTANVYLTLELTTNTPRVGVVIYAKIKNFTPPSTIGSEITTIKECFGIMLNQPTNKVTFQQSFNWTCGMPIVLTDVFIGWGTGNTNFCAGSSAFRCNATPSKCFSLPPGSYIAIMTPRPAAASDSACSEISSGLSAHFNLTNYETTIKNGQSLSLQWFANYDGSVFSNPIATPANYNATAATTILYAKVCSLVDANVCSAGTCTLTVNPLPANLNTSITQPTCTTATATVDIQSPVSGVTYQLKQSGVLKYTANSGGSFTGVIAGAYILFASNGTCTSTGANVNVNAQPANPATPSATVSQPSCSTATGTVSVQSPVAGITYELKQAGVVKYTANAAGTFNSVVSGTYDLVATLGVCSATGTSVTVNTQPATPNPPTICVVQPSLCGPSTGSITILSPLGGGYEYSIDNGASWQASPNFTNLAAGSVTGIKVKANGCMSNAVNCDASDCVASRIAENEPIAPGAIDTPVAKQSDVVKFDAFPVPFKDQLTIKYKFDYKSPVKIEIFDTHGLLILSKLDSESYLDKEMTFNINHKRDHAKMYVVKVTTNKGSNIKKIISAQ